ncbi:hypothetical protein D3C79_719860 [compost metagenome]
MLFNQLSQIRGRGTCSGLSDIPAGQSLQGGCRRLHAPLEVTADPPFCLELLVLLALGILGILLGLLVRLSQIFGHHQLGRLLPNFADHLGLLHPLQLFLLIEDGLEAVGRLGRIPVQNH